jgi:hypothetical protein
MRLLVIALISLLATSLATAANSTGSFGVFSNDNDSLGGLWVAVARNGIGFEKRFHESARICDVQSNVDIQIASDPVSTTSAPPPWNVSVKQGQCTCIDQPASLFVQNSGAAQQPFSGTYQWLRKAACKAGPAPTSLPALPKGMKVEAKCGPLMPTGNANAAVCTATLPTFGRKRICFSDGWNHMSTGGSFPADHVTLFLDGKLYRTPAVSYDIRWSYIAKGCIDVAGVQNVWFNLQGDGNYPAENVDQIVFTVQTRF